MAYQGYYGTSHDRYSYHNEQSTLHKMKETYWTTKQVVMRKLGKKEDEHIVASDSQLDSKLEVFKAIQKSCMDLLRVIEKYQDRICALSQEENAMGRLLKTRSQQDKTRAGKMMAAVGKAQSFSSQQRLALRVPLVRLYQEVETFRYRAISDTLMTINRMERARTEYRGALLWMKDISEELDPDTYKQLEKFRKVQAQVKKTKAHFDKLKLDTMQKIDLLAASRCNMFSHVLANYQTTLLHFWQKTSRTMSAVAESFKGYQYYEFNILKELTEPSKKLAEETGAEAEETGSEVSDTTDETDSRKNGVELMQQYDSSDSLLHVDHLSSSNDSQPPEGDLSSPWGEEDQSVPPHTLLQDNLASKPSVCLISFEDDAATRSAQPAGPSQENLLGPEVPPKGQMTGDLNLGEFFDFADEEDGDVEDIKRKQDEEFDFSGKILASREDRKQKTSGEPSDLLTEEFEPEFDADKDDIALLNEILNTPSTEGDDFSHQWHAVFGAGAAPGAAGGGAAPGAEAAGGEEQTDSIADFLPSNLLASMSLQPGAAGGPASVLIPAVTSPAAPSKKPDAKPAASKQEKKSDMSAWFNLFADLDPLANPDAIGRQTEEPTDAL